ncbi:MAG: helicase-related protein [Thermoplasmata archaeon]
MLLDNPLLVRGQVEERAYQVNIARVCLERSTLVVLPTGMGKTVVALLVLAERLRAGAGRVLFLAPTKPLVEQHTAFLRARLQDDLAVGTLTGEVAPADREWTWIHDEVIVSTPQVVRNDLKHERMTLEGFGLVVFDEAHRAVGDYAYVPVGEAYKGEAGLVMGMTASPGSDPERILEVTRNLGIEGVEIRTEFDPDVVNYIHDVKMERATVSLPPPMVRIRDLLGAAFQEVASDLQRRGFLPDRRRATVREIVAAQKRVSQRLARGEKNYHLYRAASNLAVALKINHASVMLETQGLGALRSYADRLEREAREDDSSKASKALVRIPKVQEALKQARSTRPEDPKVAKVREIMAEQFASKPESRVILFTHYRETSDKMVRELAQVPGIKPFRFVGQADRAGDPGLSQREQADLVERFKAGEFNVMVATSVAEEGLDIPSTDLVVFYEPIPSEIRTIQRRGRTGRDRPGRVVVVVTKDSRDEAYLYSARSKERKMHVELDRLRERLKQRILVGKPGGGFFTAPKLDDETSRLLLPEEDEEEPVPRRPRSKRAQASLTDYDAS